jgi:hypothetical protein
MKVKGLNDADFLALLERVLPTTTPDPRLASAIYEEVARQLRLINSVKSFEKYCAEGSLPDLEPATVAEFKGRLEETFGAEKVSVAPSEKGDSVAVEIQLPDRKVSNRLKVLPPGTVEEEESKAVYVPFPVTLPDDPDLVWILARREDLAPEEAARALTSLEEEFWETKAGLKLLKDRVEKNFAEFIANVPAAALADHGLKRHYKEPEPRKTLHRGPSSSDDATT